MYKDVWDANVDGVDGLSRVARTSLFADEIAVDGIALDSGPVGHGSLPSARLKYCNNDIKPRNDVRTTNTTKKTRLSER